MSSTEQLLPWERFQREMSPFLDRIMIVVAFVAAVSGALLLIDTTSRLFVFLDGAATIVALGCIAGRRVIPDQVKLAVIAFVATAYGTISFISAGLFGVGPIALLFVQILAAVFLKPGRAWTIMVVTVGVVLVFAALVATSLLDFDDGLFARLTSPVRWIILAFEVAACGFACGLMIMHLRSRLLRTVYELETANETLRESRQHADTNRAAAEHLAYYDRLTGLPNRNWFEKHVQRRIDEGTQFGYFVIMDIRRFRIINAIAGGGRGDAVLRAVGEALSRYTEQGIAIARLGGDEFAAWVEGATHEELRQGIDAFHADFDRRLTNSSVAFNVQFVVSVARYPNDGTTFDDGMRKAAIALRHAKDTGQTELVQFDESMLVRVETDVRMRQLLERDIADGAFSVHYQPKVNIATGETVGVEALARWSPPELGAVPPDVFVPILTRADLIDPFGRVIFDRILEDIPRIRKRYGEAVSVSMNVSPMYFLRAGFVDYLVSRLRETNVDPTALTLEITEDIFVDDIETVQTIILELRGAGLRVSLDDFGKGYSSLYYISHISIDELKVDKTFIDNICTDDRNFRLFASICDIAATFGFHVVAEGVETLEQVDALRRTTCSVVQGFYYARPEPLE